MGLTRKLLSVSTLGAVDFRSDKERTAKSTAKTARQAKQAAKESKKQTALLAAQANEAAKALEEQQRAANSTSQASTTRDLVAQLSDLAALHQSGALSDAEFQVAKETLLRGTQGPER